MRLSFKEDFNKIKILLNNNKIGVIPTDTIYGLVTKFGNKEGLERIYDIKMRPKEKKIAVLCSSFQQIIEEIVMNKAVEKLLKFLPGPITIIAQLKQDSIYYDAFQGVIGIRVPEHNELLTLISEINVPLYATSVNISGKAALKSIEEMDQQILTKLDFIVEDAKPQYMCESTIYDATSDEILIIRQGQHKLI